MRVCQRCGEENPDRARFCLNCGEPLAEPDRRRKERKYATALFADLVGSTAYAEREDPEVVQSVVGRTFDRLSEEIARYEGFLEKFMGDAVLSVFGVPRAHEDDAERAVRAGLEMQAVLSELNRGFVAEGKPPLEMRIGIEAGEVLVDVDRVGGPRDRMLTGDAVNTAARLQTVSEPGRVVVGPGVYAATKDVIEYRDLEPLDLKGKAERVPAWEALRIKAKQRGERPQLGMEASLVGRDEELAVLKQTFRRIQSEGRPALVTVVGPAGVGKSRLVRELERHVEGLPEFVYWRRGRCLAYGNVSYSALADTIKAQCEILDDDATDVALKKTEAAVRELFGDEEIVPQIAALVGAGEPGSLSRDDLFEAWRRFLERMAARYPLVLVFEDVHWADEGLLDFIDHVADWAQGPILVVALARPELFERRPSWGGGKRNAASIYLDPLSAEESAAMLRDLLGGGVTEELTGAITTRSEGNPLYVEEIVRMLIDDGSLRATEASTWEVATRVDDVELPRSIQGLIAARLDGLPEDEKSLLQDAAVVGRVFWTGALATLSGRPLPEVREALGRLRVKELVLPNEPSSFSDEHEYAFRHGLIRDGAYDSLPKALRAEKHAQVGEWAEMRAGDRVDEIAALIAAHELEALRYLDELGAQSDVHRRTQRDAYRWSKAAADRAAALWLAADAIEWYREALALAAATEAPLAQRAQLALEVVRVSWGVQSSEETERACREALELCRAAGDERGAGEAEAALTMVLFQQGRPEEALEAGARAVSRLTRIDESPELAEALRSLGQFHWRRGDSAEADANLRRAIDVAGRVGAPAVRAAALQDLAVATAQTGHTDEAMATMEEAFQAAKEVGDRVNLQRAYNNFASLLVYNGSDLARAWEIILEGIELAERSRGSGWMGWIQNTAAEISINQGKLREGERRARVSIDHATAAGDQSLVGLSSMILAWALAWRGLLEPAEEAWTRGERILSDMPEPQATITLERVAAELAIAAGREDDALRQLELGANSASAYSVDQDPRVLMELIRVRARRQERSEADRARAILAGGGAPFSRALVEVANGLLEVDPAAAVASLRTAVGRLEELGMRVDLARALVDLGRAIRRAGGDPTSELARAREVLEACDARLFLPEVDAELRSAGI